MPTHFGQRPLRPNASTPAATISAQPGHRMAVAHSSVGRRTPNPPRFTSFLPLNVAFPRNQCRPLQRASSMPFSTTLRRPLAISTASMPALREPAKNKLEIASIKDTNVLFMVRYAELSRVFAAFHFGDKPVNAGLPVPGGTWRKLLDSSDLRWAGPRSRIPLEISSRGQTALPLLRWSFALFLQSQ